MPETFVALGRSHTARSACGWLLALAVAGVVLQPLSAQTPTTTPTPTVTTTPTVTPTPTVTTKPAVTPTPTQTAKPVTPGAPGVAPRLPEIPPGALEEAFRILMSALVLAVLLESAFALLFNWRLFLEFFVGKAWRTPIMFVAALIIVRYFHLDLMARLFDVYSPETDPQKYPGNLFTQTITAMVLAGGSVGVNRVLVALRFREEARPEAVQPKLEATEAYVAIRVLDASPTSRYRVNVDVVDPIPPEAVTTLGFVGGTANLWPRLIDLLFPVTNRIPRSGGMRVPIAKAYRISITDLSTNTHYDTLGDPIKTTSASQVFKFFPKAIVDFNIRLKPMNLDVANPG